MKIYCVRTNNINTLFDRINDKDLWVHVYWYGAPAWIKVYGSAYVHVITDNQLSNIQGRDPLRKREAVSAYINNTASTIDVPWTSDVIDVMYPLEFLTTAELFLLEE